MSEANYTQLTGNYYFDPVKKIILKKLGQTSTRWSCMTADA